LLISYALTWESDETSDWRREKGVKSKGRTEEEGKAEDGELGRHKAEARQRGKMQQAR
jgi:ribosomal protein L32E